MKGGKMHYWHREGVESGQEWSRVADLEEIEEYIKKLSASLQCCQPWLDLFGAIDYVSSYQDDPDWTDEAARAFWHGFNQGLKHYWEKNISRF